MAAPAYAINAGATESTAPRIPFKSGDDTFGGGILRVLGSLVAVALLGVGAVYLLKRYLPSLYHPTFAGSSRIKVVEIRRLTPKTTLFLVELDGVRLLLGQHNDGITTLYEHRNASASNDSKE